MEGEGLGGQPVDDEKILSHNYETNEIRKPESVADLGRETLALHHVFGRDYSRRGNLHLIEDDRIIYATSSAIVLEYLSTGQKEYLLSLDENGIGCVVVHPSMYADYKISLFIKFYFFISFLKEIFRSRWQR